MDKGRKKKGSTYVTGSQPSDASNPLVQHQGLFPLTISFKPHSHFLQNPSTRLYLKRRHIEIFRKPTIKQSNPPFPLLLLTRRSPPPTIPQNRRHHQSRPTHTRHIRTTRRKRR